MSQPLVPADSGYAFLKGGFPYSQGVKALAGHAIERARFAPASRRARLRRDRSASRGNRQAAHRVMRR